MNGIHDAILYKNGRRASEGLYCIDGEYYLANYKGEFVSNGKYYASTTYCDLPVGNYSFDVEGKMLNGVENIDGTLYLYKNGRTVSEGLFEVDGEYYYATWGGKLKVNGRYYAGITYCDLPVGNYSFGADGKMLNGVEDVDGTLYLYKNGTTVSEGLFKVDGEYYYATWGGKLNVNGKYYVSTIYCDLSKGNYTFGADGKMLNGFVTKDDGIYYYENGNTPAPKMIFIDGYYYYVSWGGKLLTNGSHYVPADGVYNDIPVLGNFNELGQLIV